MHIASPNMRGLQWIILLCSAHFNLLTTKNKVLCSNSLHFPSNGFYLVAVFLNIKQVLFDNSIFCQVGENKWNVLVLLPSITEAIKLYYSIKIVKHSTFSLSPVCRLFQQPTKFYLDFIQLVPTKYSPVGIAEGLLPVVSAFLIWSQNQFPNYFI